MKRGLIATPLTVSTISARCHQSGSAAHVASYAVVEAPWLEMAVSKAATGQGAAESGTPGISVEQLCHRNAGDESRVWKTHAPRKFAPWTAANPGAKMIVVSRHAKDCAVSMLHHTRNIPGFGFTGGWEEFAELFLSGRVESSSFWEWHAGWWAASTRGGAGELEILWVTFEALKADLLGEVRRLRVPRAEAHRGGARRGGGAEHLRRDEGGGERARRGEGGGGQGGEEGALPRRQSRRVARGDDARGRRRLRP